MNEKVIQCVQYIPFQCDVYFGNFGSERVM